MSNKRERERDLHTKKNGRRRKKTTFDTLNIFFFSVCLFVSDLFKAHFPVKPFLRVTKVCHKTERDHIRLEKKKKKRRDKEEEEEKKS